MSGPSQPSPEPIGGTPAAIDLTGKTLGDFKLLRRLGQGGMGQVYLSEQISLKRKVALKILKAELAANPTSLKRFKAEAQVVARATHANIVQVYAVDEANGIHYMALEYVEGTTLRDYLAKKGPPEVPLALSIMRQVAAALARAGEVGITHRDIKPDNILMTKKVEVKVADFGLSRDDQQPLNVTATGVTMGTPLYMSPEQVQGKPVDPRSDIYSFGVTCYHLLSGNPPFRGQSAFEVAMHHVQTQATPLHAVRPDLPVDLCAAVDKMMAKAPEERYQTGREILRELNRIREMLTGSTQVQSTPLAGTTPAGGTATVAPSSKPVATIIAASGPRRRGLLVAVPLSLLLALAGGGALALFRQHASSARPVEQHRLTEQEQFLRQQVAANPGDDPKRLEASVRAHVDLGLFLLEEGRHKEAGEFFNHLVDNPRQEYRDVGKLGQAIVLAYQDQPGPSNQLFLESKKKLDANLGKPGVWNNPRLRFVIARALDRNAAVGEATKEPLPAELEPLRQPSTLLARPPRDKK